MNVECRDTKLLACFWVHHNVSSYIEGQSQQRERERDPQNMETAVINGSSRDSFTEGNVLLV